MAIDRVTDSVNAFIYSVDQTNWFYAHAILMQCRTKQHEHQRFIYTPKCWDRTGRRKNHILILTRQQRHQLLFTPPKCWDWTVKESYFDSTMHSIIPTTSPIPTLQVPYPTGMGASVPGQPQFIVPAHSPQFMQASGSDQKSGYP